MRVFITIDPRDLILSLVHIHVIKHKLFFGFFFPGMYTRGMGMFIRPISDAESFRSYQEELYFFNLTLN